MDLVQWRKHIDQVVADEGEWVGVADENGYPIYELTGSVTFPESHLQPASAEVVVNVQPGDRVVDDLVGDRLGVADSSGRLVPANGPTRLLVLERAGRRRAATITHSVVSGITSPSQLVIHAVDLLDGLAWWPCPSIPGEGWEKGSWSEWKTDASGEQYGKPRQLAAIKFATKLENYALRGKAKSVLRDVVQDSFDAVNALYGWGSEPHAVVDWSGGEDKSGEIALRVTDDSVWETISESARTAGLRIDVDLWWPGDDPIRVRKDEKKAIFEKALFPHPIQVVRISELEEA